MKSWRGLTPSQIRNRAQAMSRKYGYREASKLCGVSSATLAKLITGKEVTLGVLVSFAEGLPGSHEPRPPKVRS